MAPKRRSCCRRSSGRVARRAKTSSRSAPRWPKPGCCRTTSSQAAAALGRPPDALREPIPDAQLSTLWRLHGRITFARGEQSRAIALHSRALKHAELAHDSRAIGLAHYELALCYKQVGDSGIVREHLTEAASALHAAGDRRHLALVHSLSAVLLAQSGRTDEATTALRQGERLAMAIQADDVLAGIVHNQANVALMRHHHEQALALAERSVALHENARVRATASPSRWRRSARSSCSSATSSAPSRSSRARSTSAARSSSTRRPAPSSTRSRRFT